MTSFPDDLIARYRSKGALIDANLLLLFFVGGTDRTLITTFDRTKQFEPEDYDLLDRLLLRFRRRVITPNVLTEVSNLAGQLQGNHRRAVFESMRKGFKVLEEEYQQSRPATERSEFLRLGLTDAALMALAAKKYLLLTVDFPLSNHCQAAGIDVLNFNHLRAVNW